jgi:hypothetical protein
MDEGIVAALKDDLAADDHEPVSGGQTSDACRRP